MRTDEPARRTRQSGRTTAREELGHYGADGFLNKKLTRIGGSARTVGLAGIRSHGAEVRMTMLVRARDQLAAALAIATAALIAAGYAVMSARLARAGVPSEIALSALRPRSWQGGSDASPSLHSRSLSAASRDPDSWPQCQSAQ